MSKASRDKGAAFEREIGKRISAALGVDCRRKLGQARDGGDDLDLPGYAIECKRRAAISTYDWWGQVLSAALPQKKTPILIMRADKMQPLVVMDMDDWLQLMRNAMESGFSPKPHTTLIDIK